MTLVEIQYYSHLCACGCGGQIEIKKRHKYDGIPQYIHNHHMIGKKRGKQSKEHLFKLSQSRKGRKAWNKGIPQTQEAKNKNSESHKGKKLTEEHKQKISQSNKGKKRDEQFRQKISKLHKGKKISTIQKDKLKESHIWQVGEFAPNWQGGKSFEIYPQEFKKVKQSILERDFYICKDPNCEHLSERLDIHHIDYDKKNNSPENLITLCRKCHMKTNGKKRIYYTEFYHNILEEKCVSVS